MRNSRGCRPCHPCRPCGGQSEFQGHHNRDQVETIVEPTVHCRVEERHHHHKVRHIVPIVYHQRHHHHKHHEYVVKRKYTQDHQHHEHGKFEGNWCEADQGHGGKGESHGKDHGYHCDEGFIM